MPPLNRMPLRVPIILSWASKSPVGERKGTTPHVGRTVPPLSWIPLPLLPLALRLPPSSQIRVQPPSRTAPTEVARVVASNTRGNASISANTVAPV
jgi:hypothetical protein